MKKSLLMIGGAIAAAVLMSGCAGIVTHDGAVGPVAMGPNFYTEVSANSMIQPVSNLKYSVVKRNVTSKAVLHSFFTCINLGDISYATLKKAALQNAPGANDLVDVQMDYTMNNILGINKVTVTLTATAVKY